MSTPTTIITIGGTAYGSSSRTANRFRAIDALVKRIDEGDDECAFTLVGIGPVPLFTCGQSVSITVNGTAVFTGDVEHYSQNPSDHGWIAAFSASGLKTRAARVPTTGGDGSGQAIYNRAPDDPDYVSSDAGLTVGQIVQRVLEISDTATALDALGVGAYSGGALPAATTTDLAALSVVPATEVAFSGDNVFGQVEQFIKKYHPKYGVYIKPDGTIRVVNLFTMSAHSLVVPGLGTGDPVTIPNFTRSTAGCYTKLTIKGRDIQKAELSVADDSLTRGWSGGDESSWRYSDFIEPKDARDEGAITAITSTTATCDPDDNTATAALNYWTPANRAGWIQLYYPAGTGIDIFETRPITASTALSAGGTYTITWDSSLPLSHTNYTRYRIVGRSGGLIDVGRLYLIKEHSSGNTGTNTYVGSRLTRRFPRPVPWANNGKSFDITTAAGLIQWSQSGSRPYIEFPVPVEIVPSLGAVRFTEPVFTATANPPLTPSSPYPADYAAGKPVDVRVAVAYNRGALSTTVPSSSWEGTAYTRLGLEREKVIHLDTWTYNGDTTSITALAQEYLDVVKDEVIEGSITYLGYPSFDPLAMGYSLNLTIQGVTGPLDGIDLPVRSVTLRWPQGAAVPIEVGFNFSNRRRPFEADDLYIHPAFHSGGWGQSSGSPFEGGQTQGLDLSGVSGLSQTAMGDSGPGMVDPSMMPGMNAGMGGGGGGNVAMPHYDLGPANTDLSGLDLSAAVGNAPASTNDDFVEQMRRFAEGGE